MITASSADLQKRCSRDVADISFSFTFLHFEGDYGARPDEMQEFIDAAKIVAGFCVTWECTMCTDSLKRFEKDSVSLNSCACAAMVARTTCNRRVASSSLACVTFVFFFWQGLLVHIPLNAASRGLSVHSKRPHFSVCVSTGNTLSFLR